MVSKMDRRVTKRDLGHAVHVHLEEEVTEVLPILGRGERRLLPGRAHEGAAVRRGEACERLTNGTNPTREREVSADSSSLFR